MSVEQLKVKYSPVKNCFVYLPTSWTKKLTKVSVIIVTNNDETEKKNYYFSYGNSQFNYNDNLFCINATFAQLFNIKEGNNLAVNLRNEVPILTSINVLPKNKDDFEIVSLRANKLQELILQQISIVAINQPFVIWLSKNLNVTLIVESMSPHYHYGKLQQFTEVHVSNYVNKPQSISKFVAADNLSSVSNKPTEFKNFFENYKIKNMSALFRVCLLENDNFFLNNDHDIYCDLIIFISLSQSIKWFSIGQEKYFFCTFENILNETKESLYANNDLFDDNNKKSVVKMIIIDHLDENKKLFETIDRNIVFVTKNVAKQLKVQTGSKVILNRFVIEQCEKCETIELIPINNKTNNAINNESFLNYVKQFEQSVLINSHSKIASQNLSFYVKLTPSCHCVLLNKETIKNVNIIIKDSIDEQSKKNDDEIKPSKNLIKLKTMETIITECKTICSIILKSYSSKQFKYDGQNILIYGDTGTGKTTLCETLFEQLSKSPYYYYCKTIDCKKLKSKKVEVVSKLLIQTTNDCLYYQPAILFLDNIDCITNNRVPGNEENSPDSINATRIADTLVNIVSNYQTMHCISLIATCLNIERLGTQLKTKRGLKLFTRVLKIGHVTKDERCKIMKNETIQKRLFLSPNIIWDCLGDKTESFVLQDLVDFVEKACYNAWKRKINSSGNSNDEIVLTNDDLINTLEGFNSIASHALPLFSGSGHCWSDIGGLNNIKDCLVEILQWPLIYTELYENAPIKQQSGVLLYGMPGTGKTMLAGAIAKECGLNFINIKGPELLSKYIGASEEAVREIFQKAQRAKPCVLFFDEFDSLAPRRGHDSTGVTDRVVNQLLTQFDGVEGREGVAIVAASSRPDLLDPALLRPGRLDKTLLCPLPQQDDREEILKVLCTKHNLNQDDFDLKLLAKMSINFTGADLNAVFIQARMNAIDNNYFEISKNKNKNNIKISQECLLKSLDSTQPSLTEKEIIKFNFIYKKFSNGGNFSEELLKNQKLTLA
ncbi:peroxisomal ATPase PEX1 [Microplitis demolitor]|uniref:peroxisomal ATPase PEX1 n=1 Tax=Microplitis demolitor TaxID=69319 RepID=UPI0006D51EDA|nr:peroxisomal ATPase PEX1 [Microplitis demolitor]